jgi:hypothetical protein
MYISKYRSGSASAKISANVEFETSPSRPTTSPSALPGRHFVSDLVSRE